MQLYGKYISPLVDTFAYCLLRNHFHFLVRIKTDLPGLLKELRSSGITDLPGFQNLEGLIPKPPYRYFSNCFNAYTKAFNKAYDRTGCLFEKNFKRKPVTNDFYFTALITYIHHNPQKHGLIDDGNSVF
jgi:putative transposase